MAIHARHCGQRTAPTDAPQDPPTGPPAWRAGARYEPVVASVRLARRFVEAELGSRGIDELADDAGLVVAELSANAVLHARTPFEVVVRSADSDRVRIEVLDGSSVLPFIGAVSRTSMSGRGMVLVAALAARWGAERTPEGKVVWFEVGVTGTEEALPHEPGAEELLAMWDDLEEAPTVVVTDLPVQELLAAKEHMDDLVRELQIVMHDPAFVARAESEAPEQVRLARRLDAAVQQFESARLQVRSQVTRAARAGAAHVTLELVLDSRAGEYAQRYLDVLEEAEQLSLQGLLLTRCDQLGRHAAVRRRYLEEVVRQLR